MNLIGSITLCLWSLSGYLLDDMRLAGTYLGRSFVNYVNELGGALTTLKGYMDNILKVLAWLSVLFGDGRPVIIDKVNYCVLDREHLTLDQKIEIGIGCSTVDGKKAYSQERLKWWYNDGKSYNTEDRIKKWKQNKQSPVKGT